MTTVKLVTKASMSGKKTIDRKIHYTVKGVTYHRETHDFVSCLFCRIHRREEPGTIVYEDEEFVVFRPRSPVTRHHYLITTREHIKDLSSIHEIAGNRLLDGVTLLYRLKQAGMRAILKNNGSKQTIEGAKYCFHAPPFNSIDHLHLHVIGEPETMTLKDWWRFPTWFETFYCTDIHTVLQSLSPAFFEHLNQEEKHFDPHHII